MHTYHTPCEMELNNNNVRSFDCQIGWQLDARTSRSIKPIHIKLYKR